MEVRSSSVLLATAAGIVDSPTTAALVESPTAAALVEWTTAAGATTTIFQL